MNTPMVEHKDSFIEYLTSRRTVKSRLKSKTAREYVSYLESAAHALSIVIGPSSLSAEESRSSILRQIANVDRPKSTRTNWGSAVNAYFEFVNQEADYTSPDEVSSTDTYIEGATRRVTVNAFERDGKARVACINKHGLNCAVCRMNFADTYGEIGKDFIHVHHLKQLSKLGKDYRIDPEKDLIPVCPNCHAMLHRRKDILSIVALRRLYRGNKGTR